MLRFYKAIAAMAISAATFLAPGLCTYADNDYLAGTNPEGEMETTTSNTVTVDYVGNFVYENGTLTRILFEGGYVDMTGAAPEYMFYLTDHLGNVRVVADSEGNIAQVNHYYPYGDRFSDSRYALSSSSTSSNDRLFGGKELDSSSGLHDFEARYDNTRFGRFTTMDPMAEKYYGISPYAYCAGNPINRVDPDGMTDYFNEFGDRVFRDLNDNGGMMYIPSSAFKEVLDLFEGSLFSSEALQTLDASSYSLQSSFKNGILGQDFIKNIINQYNNTGFPIVFESLIDKDGKRPTMEANNRGPNHTCQISVDLDEVQQSSLLENSYNLINAINDHEGFHIREFLKDPTSYNKNSKEIREQAAIINQMNSISWGKTSIRYQKDVMNYEERINKNKH